MTTLAARLDAITEADRTIAALNRGSGPVLDLLPALVHKTNVQHAALEHALRLLSAYGPIEADTDDLLRMQGRLRHLGEKEHA